MAKKKADIDDRFLRFGHVGFTATTQVNDFVTLLEEGKLAATRCKGCQRVYFPPRAHCCQCLKADMQWEAIEGHGRLVTFSQLKFGPAGFQDQVPYIVALADFGTCKVFGRMADGIDEDQLAVGMTVRPAVKRLDGGRITYVFETA